MLPVHRYLRLDESSAQQLWDQTYEQAGRQLGGTGGRIRRISLLSGLVLPVRTSFSRMNRS